MKLLAMNMDATPGLLGTFMQAQPLRVQNLITCIVFYSSVTSCLYTLAYLALQFLLPVLLHVEEVRSALLFGFKTKMLGCYLLRIFDVYFVLE